MLSGCRQYRKDSSIYIPGSACMCILTMTWVCRTNWHWLWQKSLKLVGWDLSLHLWWMKKWECLYSQSECCKYRDQKYMHAWYCVLTAIATRETENYVPVCNYCSIIHNFENKLSVFSCHKPIPGPRGTGYPAQNLIYLGLAYVRILLHMTCMHQYSISYMHKI